MNWIPLREESQITKILEQSKLRPQVIFKHSTRCPVSSMAKRELDAHSAPANIDFHYLDLIAYRSVSNSVAEQFFVEHESPQVLLIVDEVCVYNESHSHIRMSEIVEAVH